MGTWRPSNWEKIKPQKPMIASWESAVEAGADAMLKALRDARFPSTANHYVGIEITPDGNFLIILKE